MYMFKISKLLTSVAEQADLSVSWSKTSEDRFSRDVAQLLILLNRNISE